MSLHREAKGPDHKSSLPGLNKKVLLSLPSFSLPSEMKPFALLPNDPLHCCLYRGHAIQTNSLKTARGFKRKATTTSSFSHSKSERKAASQ